MKINSKPKRILVMIGIGAGLVLIFYALGVPQKSIGVLTGGILFALFCENICVYRKKIVPLQRNLCSNYYAMTFVRLLKY